MDFSLSVENIEDKYLYLESSLAQYENLLKTIPQSYFLLMKDCKKNEMICPTIQSEMQNFIDEQKKYINVLEEQSKVFNNTLDDAVCVFMKQLEPFKTKSQEFIQLMTSVIQDIKDNLELKKKVIKETQENIQCIQKPCFVYQGSENKYFIDDSILENNPGSYFSTLYNDIQSHTTTGDIYIDTDESYLPQVLTYLKGDSISINKLKEIQKVDLAEKLAFYKVPFRVELLDLREPLEKHKIRMITSSGLICLNGENLKWFNDLMKKYRNRNTIISKNVQSIQFSEEKNMYMINIDVKDLSVLESYCAGHKIYVGLYNSYTSEEFLELLNNLCIPITKQLIQEYHTFDGSTLVTTEYDKQLTTWIGDTHPWTLLYKASRDGFSSSIFHDICDNHLNVIVLIKATINNKESIFGGFTSVGFSLGNNDEDLSFQDSLSYLFTLKTPNENQPLQYTNKKPESSSLYCSYHWGPLFVDGFYICNEANQSNYNCIYHSDKKSTYNDATHIFYNAFSITDSQDPIYFKVDDYEIFEKKTS
ncbi:hypothetical protein WA158_000422 [Blastocystis sp. Blastoise]